MKSKIKNNKEPVGISLLKSFSEKELAGFSLFIANQYFNSDKVIPNLLNVLKKNVIRYDSYDSAQETKLYYSIFGEDKSSHTDLSSAQKSRLNSKYNTLTRLAERFLCVNAIEKETAIKNQLLYKELLNKKQYALFNRHINKEKKVLESQDKIDLEFHNNALVVEQAVLDHAHQTSNLGEVNLQDLNYQYDVQYILKKLGLYITMLSNESIYEKKYNKASMQIALDLIQLSDYKDHALINLTYSTVNLIIQQNKIAFDSLLTLLDRQWLEITKDDLNVFYNVSINYCAKKLRRGENMYKNIFDIYRMMHEKDLLVEGSVFPESKLKNIVAVCCKVGEFNWAKNIIDNYRQYIRKPIRESVCHFHFGALAFYQQDYNLALHHFIRVESIDINHDVNCRALLLRSHYEVDSDYDERTVQIFRSTEKYFYENKALTSNIKKGYRNFIRTLINLYRIKHFATKMSKERLREKLEQQDLNIDKNWLLQKIDELK